MIKEILYQVSWWSNNDVQMLILLFFPILTVMSNMKCQLKMNSMKVKGKAIPQHHRKLHITYWLKMNKSQVAIRTWRPSSFIILTLLYIKASTSMCVQTLSSVKLANILSVWAKCYYPDLKMNKNQMTIWTQRPSPFIILILGIIDQSLVRDLQDHPVRPSTQP